jgi:hypothetical protein
MPAVAVPDPIVGSRLSSECNFRIAGVLTDPAAVICTVKSPAGNVTTYTYPAAIFRDTAGVYRAEFVADEAGTWWVRFEGSGVVEAVNETAVSVRASSVI